MAVITGTTIGGIHVVRIDDREYRNVNESNWRRISRFCQGGTPKVPQARPPMQAFRTWWNRPAKSSAWVMTYKVTPSSLPDRVKTFGSYDEAHSALPIDSRYEICPLAVWERWLDQWRRPARQRSGIDGYYDALGLS